jgi:putative ABC transport system permease protein
MKRLRKWFEPVISAWVGVLSHKLRSFLTILGIVIGVGAVIALMSIGKGAQADIVSRISTLGSNLITIRPGFTQFGGVRSAAGSATTLTLEDAEAIAEKIPNISAVAPYNQATLQVIAGSENMNARINGVTPEYKDVYNWQTTSGAFFTEYEYERGAKVALLGSSAKETLFPDTEPVGQRMRMGNNIVLVIGVLQSKGDTMGLSDDTILIPLTALQQMVAQSFTSRGEHIISSIALTVTDEEQAATTVDKISSLLRERHQLAAGADNDFRITSMEEISQTLSETTGTMTLLLGAIAAISLLVGGIGVMNIMLVSVLERTREIGILKALGARERDIWGQFLIEAVFLTFIGGIVGVVVGWVASKMVSHFGEMTTLVTADTVILAVSVSICIGLFFGFYPAWSASRLNPIEALRYE